MTKLPRSFYLRPTIEVARSLLGKYIVRVVKKQTFVGKIVETEAYRGALDPASHAYRGLTQRNEVMFGNGGHLYVYFTYGMHYCANVVTGKSGIGEAVLIRGVEPLAGIDEMIRNRFGARARLRVLTGLTNGPAKFCQAFCIARDDNGSDLLGNSIFLLKAAEIPRSQVGISARIGITTGLDKRWRFYIKGNPWVSR